MVTPLVILVWVLNFGISWFNAWSVGRSWADSKAIGGWPRFLVWCGAIMSACGFTWCYLIVLVLIAGSSGDLDPQAIKAALELGYLVLILPILGSGLAIWLDSVTTAWRERSLKNIGVASWNTFAQVHNTYKAAKDIPGILKNLALSRGDIRGKTLLLVLLILFVALAGGVLTTFAIIHSSAKRYAHTVNTAPAPA